ncbi:MAG: twin-arginine translocase TatA/TatE family subunit [Coriobacteriia bacterium]|nr:twin-arginine translocase TatA/TatE family subunit [Coriobacteriia bacterium]
MFGISGIELVIILVVAVLIFGPDELPKLGRIVGQGLRMFNDARSEVESVVRTEMLSTDEMEMLKDPLGMKKIKEEMTTSVKNLADPSYRPPPKGAGARVATDDAPSVPTRAADIWGRSGHSTEPSTKTATSEAAVEPPSEDDDAS